jgi:hypothetical protein
MTSQPPGQWGPPPTSPPPGPPVGPPYGAAPWGPQQPPGPPKRGNGLKWVFGAVVLIVVVAVTVGATLLFTGGGSGDNPSTATNSPPTSGGDSDFASANDNGPVGIITEDPTCASWEPIGDSLSAQEGNGWTDRDPSVPASSWSAEQRNQYEAVGRAMSVAADQAVALSKLTPHRVVRELYEQFIAYSRTYADRIPTYTPSDDHLAGVSSSTGAVLTWICAAITYSSAPARAPLVPPGVPPVQASEPGDPTNPQRFLTSSNPVCADWAAAISQFNTDIAEWRTTDPNIPASQWTPQQQELATAATPIMREYLHKLQDLGRESDNATLRDFAELSAQYRRAYMQSLLSYTPADNYLAHAATDAAFIVLAACQAAGS